MPSVRPATASIPTASSRTVDLSTLPERFAEGNITRHPDMPNWQFEEVDMEGLIAYLETVQMPDGE